MTDRTTTPATTPILRRTLVTLVAVLLTLMVTASVLWTWVIGAPAVGDYPALHEALGEAVVRLTGR